MPDTRSGACPDARCRTLYWRQSRSINHCHGKLVAGSRQRSCAPGSLRCHCRQYKRVILDLSDLKHTDSMGLGKLVRLYVSAKSDGCSLELMHPERSRFATCSA